MTASKRALIIGAIAAVVSLAASLAAPTVFFRAYLAAYILWLAVPLGSAAVLMTHHLATGRWGKALRPALESAVTTTPLLPIFFLPLLAGVRTLYPWANPEAAGIARGSKGALLEWQRRHLCSRRGRQWRDNPALSQRS